jgi:serine/threonine protein kinase
MDYFDVGGRPLLTQFPPHISGIFKNYRYAQDPHAPDAAPWVDGSDRGPGSAVQQWAGGPGQDWVAATLAGPMDKHLQDAQHVAGVVSPESGASSSSRPPPQPLHATFVASEVQAWEASRFETVRKLQDAARNRGQVHLMRDIPENKLVAVKQMPNEWVRRNHTEFVLDHPAETELPWQDVGTIRLLNTMGFEYACQLLGVYRDDKFTYVVTSFASEGDLFAWCEGGPTAGLERERVVLPIALQILKGIQQLHDMGIVHRDLSLENVLVSQEEGQQRVFIIDFSMASRTRKFRNCVRGKASYQAPELHMDGEYDAFLSDVFALGVTLYAVLLKDYPWLSTRPGGCKCFEYVRKHGFRSYLTKRKLRNSTSRVAEFMSEPLQQLLEGMLALDPKDRLTLGEDFWAGSRRSVWDLAWTSLGPG